MKNIIDDTFKDELNRLEMLPVDGVLPCLYFVADKQSATAHIRIALEQAESYEADAVYFRTFPETPSRSPLPQIYIYRDTSLSLDETRYTDIHRRLWNAGVVPLVLILTVNQVKILNCRREPEFDKETHQIRYTPFRALEEAVKVNQAFVAREISAGTLWEDPKFKKDFCLEDTAYYKLLSYLKEFRQRLVKKGVLSEPTINRILVMAILVKYLDERRDTAENRVFQKGFFRQFAQSRNDSFEALFREKGSCISLFDHLSKRFNGGIFELTDDERKELEDADLSEIANFLKGDEEPNGQRLFWPLYSFQDLPVELISNIYEEFLATRDKEASKGVVYTPPMLVDLLLDQCLPLKPETLSWKILDPACGSGVFLVGAFKRLIHCWRMVNNWQHPSYSDLQGILKNNIHGFDKEPEAVLITAFSLCVALCEELDPLVIWNKLRFDDLRQRNLLAKDFFEIVESGEFDQRFDLIIGNPPFESELTTPAAVRVEKISSRSRKKLPDSQLALLFLEQSFKLARKDATICLIQPAGPLLYNGKAAQFRHYLFNRFAINQVLDFTALEGVLFKAKVTAAAIIAHNAEPSSEKILHTTFRRTRAAKDKILFELDPYDFHWVARTAIDKKYIWKANLLGGGRLHRLLSRLFANFSTLEEYLIQKRENNGWQFGEGFNVGSGSHLNKLPNVNELADLTDEELKKRYKIKPFPHRATWITGELNVLPRQLTSKGICWNDVKPCSELFFEAPRIKNKLIFSPPHVLIREVADGLAIPAVFSDSSDSKLVFSKQIIGIHAPNADKEKLVNIAGFLNDSGISSFLAIVASGRILISRSSSLLQDDILSVPYSDSNKDIVLTDWENALVEDVMKYYVNFRRCGEDSTVLNDVSNKDLLSFGKMYCNILNPVYKEFRALSPIPMGTFICYPFCYGDTPQIELPKEETVVPYLTELLHHQHGGRLFVNRILRLYEQNVIFMIKPNQKRYWLRSIALRDADETLIDLLDQGF